mgnify:FL=1
MQHREMLADSFSIITREGVSAELFLITKKKKQTTEYEVFRTILTVESEKLLLEQIQEELSRIIAKDIVFGEYQPGLSIDRDYVAFLPVLEVPYAVEIVEKLDTLGDLDVAPYADQNFIKQIWALAVVVRSCCGRSEKLFWKFTPSKMLASRRALIWRESDLAPSNDPILNIDNKLSCLISSNNIFIFKVNSFELIFNYIEKLEENANAILGMLNQKNSGLITGVELLQMAKSDIRKLRKLASLDQASLEELATKLTPQRLARIKEDYQCDFDVDPQTGQITLEKKGVWDVLRLLSDEFLESEVTGIKYEVFGKKRR